MHGVPAFDLEGSQIKRELAYQHWPGGIIVDESISLQQI